MNNEEELYEGLIASYYTNIQPSSKVCGMKNLKTPFGLFLTIKEETSHIVLHGEQNVQK